MMLMMMKDHNHNHTRNHHPHKMMIHSMFDQDNDEDESWLFDVGIFEEPELLIFYFVPPRYVQDGRDDISMWCMHCIVSSFFVCSLMFDGAEDQNVYTMCRQ